MPPATPEREQVFYQIWAPRFATIWVLPANRAPLHHCAVILPCQDGALVDCLGQSPNAAHAECTAGGRWASSTLGVIGGKPVVA